MTTENPQKQDPRDGVMHALVVERHGPIVLLRLDRPRKHNVLDRRMVDELTTALGQAQEDDQTAVLVITGSGEDAFCAGADIHEMVSGSQEQLTEFLRATRRLFRLLAECPLPTIAAVNGHAHGGGAELACACDLRLGCEATTFRFPGVVYGMAVSTWQLPTIVGVPRAKELLFTADVIDAEESLRIGLLNRRVAQGELIAEALEVAASIARHPRDAVASIKTLVDRNVGAPLQQRFYRELYSNQDRRTATNATERFASFLERNREGSDLDPPGLSPKTAQEEDSDER